MSDPELAPTPTARPRRRTMRLMFGILMLLVAAALAAVYSKRNEMARWQIENSARKELNAPLTFSSVHVEIFPLEVKLRDLRIGQPTNFSSVDPLFSAQEISFASRLVDLLRSRKTFSHLHVVRPHFTLIRNAEGEWNYDSLEQSKKRKSRTDDQRKTEKDQKQPGVHSEFLLQLLDIRDASLTVLDHTRKEPSPVAVEKAFMEARNVLYSEKAVSPRSHFHGHGRVNGESFPCRFIFSGTSLPAGIKLKRNFDLHYGLLGLDGDMIKTRIEMKQLRKQIENTFLDIVLNLQVREDEMKGELSVKSTRGLALEVPIQGPLLSPQIDSTGVAWQFIGLIVPQVGGFVSSSGTKVSGVVQQTGKTVSSGVNEMSDNLSQGRIGGAAKETGETILEVGKNVIGLVGSSKKGSKAENSQTSARDSFPASGSEAEVLKRADLLWKRWLNERMTQALNDRDAPMESWAKEKLASTPDF